MSKPTSAEPRASSWDQKALETAREISLMWGQDRSQFVSKIQCAVLDAMRWAHPPTSAEPVAWFHWNKYTGRSNGHVSMTPPDERHLAFIAKYPNDGHRIDPLYAHPPATQPQEEVIAVHPDGTRTVKLRPVTQPQDIQALVDALELPPPLDWLSNIQCDWVRAFAVQAIKQYLLQQWAERRVYVEGKV